MHGYRRHSRRNYTSLDQMIIEDYNKSLSRLLEFNPITDPNFDIFAPDLDYERLENMREYLENYDENLPENLDKLGIWSERQKFERCEMTPGFCVAKEIAWELEKRDFRINDINVKFMFRTDKHILSENITVKCLSYVIWNGYEIHYTRNNERTRYTCIFCIKTLTNEIYLYRENFISHDEEKQIEEELKVFLEYVKSFEEVESRDFRDSLFERVKRFESREWEPYPDNYPDFYWTGGINHIREELKSDCVGVVQFGRYQICSYRDMREFPEIESNDLCTYSYIHVDINRKELHNGKPTYKIKPHYLDEIYVYELKYAKEYRDTFPKYPEREQYNRWNVLKSKEIVTLKEYVEGDMNFEYPKYVIRSNIGYDELLDKERTISEINKYFMLRDIKRQ